jgi:ABC-type uncharacterized transport system substrate-binding protein
MLHPLSKLLVVLSLGLALARSGPCIAAEPDSPDPRPRVLLVNSYHDAFPWVVSYKKGLLEVLGQGVELLSFPMDTKRLPPEAHPGRADLAWRLAQDFSPDVVVLADDAALRFLGPRLAEAGTPCVFLGINGNPRDYASGPTITGVLERPLFKRNVLLLKSLMGRAPPKVLLLFDSDRTSQVLLREDFGGRTTMDISGISVDLALIGTRGEWERTVLSARQQGYQALFLGLYHTLRDGQGDIVEAEDILRWTSGHAPVPLLCFWDFSVGARGAAGGMVLTGESQGRAAGEMVQAILAGTRPEDIMPATPERGSYLFSRTLLRRWGLTLSEDIRRAAEFVD